MDLPFTLGPRAGTAFKSARHGSLNRYRIIMVSGSRTAVFSPALMPLMDFTRMVSASGVI